MKSKTLTKIKAENLCSLFCCIDDLKTMNRGRPAWHYVLYIVPVSKIPAFKTVPLHANIDVEDYGQIIQYVTNGGRKVHISGWETDPAEKVHDWIDEHYGNNKVKFFELSLNIEALKSTSWAILTRNLYKTISHSGRTSQNEIRASLICNEKAVSVIFFGLKM